MLQITENWRVRYDDANCTLEQKKQVKKKNTNEAVDTWVFSGYYSSVLGAIKGYCREDLKAARTLDTLATRIESLEKKLEKF